MQGETSPGNYSVYPSNKRGRVSEQIASLWIDKWAVVFQRVGVSGVGLPKKGARKALLRAVVDGLGVVFVLGDVQMSFLVHRKNGAVAGWLWRECDGVPRMCSSQSSENPELSKMPSFYLGILYVRILQSRVRR